MNRNEMEENERTIEFLRSKLSPRWNSTPNQRTPDTIRTHVLDAEQSQSALSGIDQAHHKAECY
jgi:hypothetical protein